MNQHWTVRGTLAVDESWTTRCGDGTAIVRRRPLAGVCVDILGFPNERACRSSFGTVVTDRAGRFRVRAARPPWAQDLLVRVRFADALLVVGAYGAEGARPVVPWLIPLCGVAAVGPVVDFGTLAFRPGAAGPLGRQSGEAEAWYVARTALTFLRGRRESAPDAPLVIPAPLLADGDPGAALREVARWWVRTEDDAVPAGLVASAVRRTLWPAAGPAGGAERLTLTGERRRRTG